MTEKDLNPGQSAPAPETDRDYLEVNGSHVVTQTNGNQVEVNGDRLETQNRNLVPQRRKAKGKRGGRKGHRAWGSIKKQTTKTISYQASFIGPDGRRHYAPVRFSNKMTAEAWLSNEKNYRDHCSATGQRWRNVEERANEKKARSLLMGTYGEQVIKQRPKIKESTRSEYSDKWDRFIKPYFENVAVKDMSTKAVRDWFSGMGTNYPTRNAQAYTVLHMICSTAVEDGLLLANPCTIKGATTVKPKPKGEPLSVSDIFAIANYLGTQPKHRQYKYLVLIAAFCGGTRIGEAIELRRRDFVFSNGVPVILKVERGVTHRQGCTITTTKAGDQRRVDIPKLIQADLIEYLASMPDDPNTLLFSPLRGARRDCEHVNPVSFNENVLKPAAMKAIGRRDISAHSLRHAATTIANHAGLPVKDAMSRTGHKSKQVHLDYIDHRTNVGQEMADRISDYALEELAAEKAKRTA